MVLGQENAKLLKQIKNCFNDSNSLTNYATLGNGNHLSINTQGSSNLVHKAKQKLNKSYENLIAATKAKSSNNDVVSAKA